MPQGWARIHSSDGDDDRVRVKAGGRAGGGGGGEGEKGGGGGRGMKADTCRGHGKGMPENYCSEVPAQLQVLLTR